MKRSEKKEYKQVFPKLNTNRAVVTGEATKQYNCISWTIGVTSRWIWPGENISDFDKFYKNSLGYKRSSDGPIAAWGHSKSRMEHGCISGPGHGPRWESKTGSGLRFQHGLNELVGSVYGRVVQFYNKDNAQSVDSGSISQVGDSIEIKGVNTMILTEEQTEFMESVLEGYDEKFVQIFEKKFQAWVNTWDASHTLHLSDPSFVRFSKEFAELVAMGTEILPLVVNKLVDPENFFTLQLYDTIQPEAMSVVHINSDDDAILEGEQGRARRTVVRWIASQ